MRTYLRLLSYLRPYWKLFLLACVFMLLLAVASGFSISMISPFVNAVFNRQSTELPARFDILTRINRYILAPEPLSTLKLRPSSQSVSLFLPWGASRQAHEQDYSRCSADKVLYERWSHHPLAGVSVGIGLSCDSVMGELEARAHLLRCCPTVYEHNRLPWKETEEEERKNPGEDGGSRLYSS